jgi:hypothetical protein
MTQASGLIFKGWNNKEDSTLTLENETSMLSQNIQNTEGQAPSDHSTWTFSSFIQQSHTLNKVQYLAERDVFMSF